MANYKPYLTRKTAKSRRLRKGARNTIFQFNKKANKEQTK